MNKYQIILVATFALATVPAGLAQSCCGSSMASCPMTGAQMGSNTTVQARPGVLLSAPAGVAKAVMDDYTAIQAALAKDSISGISESANALAKAVQDDQTKSFPAQIPKQAEALSQATNLAAARETFKLLSQSLIGYVNTRKMTTGTYYEVYCPMAKASWLQTEKTITNPYMGQAMLECGQLVRSDKGAPITHADHAGH